MIRKSSFRKDRHVALFLALLVCLFCLPGLSAEALTVKNWQSVGISGFSSNWNNSFPDANTVDAVHRSILLRFPGSAEKIASRLRKGKKIKKVEVVFTYEGYELRPQGYRVRMGQGKEKWKKNPPRWHYVGWGLRRPWTAKKRSLAPTFNAWIKGAGYWQKYGAKNEKKDRYQKRFGPAEVSKKNRKGHMNITPLLTKTKYGESLGKRLRNFEEQGLLIRKWETYDQRYVGWSAYEWATATGGHGLSFKNAHLNVQLSNSKKEKTVKLPEPRDISKIAEELKGSDRGGEPTAVFPDKQRVKEIAEKVGFQQPDWMPDWQWERVQELRNLGGSDIHEISKKMSSGRIYDYKGVVSKILRIPPRFWKGWGIQDFLLTYYLYHDVLPDYVVDHMKAYWEAWLYPDLPNKKLITPHAKPKMQWWKKNKDWRGRWSFFRKRWTQGMGTMNFNHTANMGALLGGAILDSQYSIRDGRAGTEKMLLRHWNYQYGTSQEMLDDYYFSITISGQKMFSDFGPTQLDRVMGDMIRNRAMELLASSFHPHVRRVVGPGGRVRMTNVLGYEQEGTYAALHTLTPEGVLFHVDKYRDAKQHGMNLFGYDFPPGRAAIQASINKPFLPEWSKHWLEDKPLPYRVKAREKGLWRSAYLGHTYALASQDVMNDTVDVTAQWHGGKKPATDADQLGTFTIRYNVNKPHMAKTKGGSMPYSGSLASFQHKNRVIVASKPPHDKGTINKRTGGSGLKKLYTSLALWNFEEDPGWKIYVNGKQVEEYPISLKGGDKITIKDGRTYLGIIPLPATDIDRKKEVVIKQGEPQLLGDRHGGVRIAPALMINSYNLYRDKPINPGGKQWKRITKATYGGFVVEMGEKKTNGSFKKFQKRIKNAAVISKWQAGRWTAHLGYKSGGDSMRMGFRVPVLKGGENTKAFAYRRFNGQNPYSSGGGILRDTTLTQQGTAGRLEKQGAVLQLSRGQMGYLQTEPVSGTYVGYNPFPELTPFSLAVPGGVQVRSSGPISIARVAVNPKEGWIRVDQAYKKNQLRKNVARRLHVSGLGKDPTVELNGRVLEDVGGAGSFSIPLDLKPKQKTQKTGR